MFPNIGFVPIIGPFPTITFPVTSMFIVDATVAEPDKDLGLPHNTWSRIEPIPLSADIRPALQATIADPAWFLCRQWQFLEFAADDGGTPIQVTFQGEISPLTRFAPGAIDANSPSRARPYSADTLPLETAVEREMIWSRHPRLVAEAGQHLVRMLVAAGIGPVGDAVLKAFPLNLPAAVDNGADTAGDEWAQLARGRVIDSKTLAAGIVTARGTAATLTTLPAGLTVDGASQAKTLDVLGQWILWFQDAIVEPDGAEAWNPRRLEYAFSAAGTASTGEVVLGAQQYADGTLDWYSVAGAVQSLATPATPSTPLSVPPGLPTPVEYAGKPADRFWEFEDSNINFGFVDAGPTDLARMALIEFLLVYGNDWFGVPLTLPVGSVFHVTKFTVRDTFGIDVDINPSRNTGATPWSVFNISGGRVPEGALFLAPTLIDTIESAPIEEVALFRDEMANMVWGVERKVQGISGDPYDRTSDEYQRAAQQQVDGPPVDAQLIYRLATSVPDNWIPFVPVPAEGSNPGTNPVIQLQRRTLIRTQPDGTRVNVQPYGMLLRSDPTQPASTEPQLRIEEEEVPREGAVVTRTFQFGRWFDGRSLLWVGKRKRIGRGEGPSGLRFDVSEKG
ncbi:MAG TPA: hypothetical protein VK636_21560 [Gemmatimonadaceae bacterium]|nr:hypothetical protein [Gemmatimonadaceae bacterium]